MSDLYSPRGGDSSYAPLDLNNVNASLNGIGTQDRIPPDPSLAARTYIDRRPAVDVQVPNAGIYDPSVLSQTPVLQLIRRRPVT